MNKENIYFIDKAVINYVIPSLNRDELDKFYVDINNNTLRWLNIYEWENKVYKRKFPKKIINKLLNPFLNIEKQIWENFHKQYSGYNSKNYSFAICAKIPKNKDILAYIRIFGDNVNKIVEIKK